MKFKLIFWEMMFVLIPIIKVNAQTEIVFRENTTNVISITQDSLRLLNGSTYSYTIDTPKESGLVSTAVTVDRISEQIKSKDGSKQFYKIIDKYGKDRLTGEIKQGDKLIVTDVNSENYKKYSIGVASGAKSGALTLGRKSVSANTKSDVTLFFTAGQRTPNATVKIKIPSGIHVTMDNTTVNVIGRGEVKLKDLSKQSIGRTGAAYSYSKVGEVNIETSKKGENIIIFKNLDLRPFNGIDLKITIQDVDLAKTGEYMFTSSYTTASPEILCSPGVGSETALLKVVSSISDFKRVLNTNYLEYSNPYQKVDFEWTPTNDNQQIQILESINQGKTWSVAKATINAKKGNASISNLESNQLYSFKLKTSKRNQQSFSNKVYFLSGSLDIKSTKVSGKGVDDDTKKINKAIDSLSRLGGGTLYFSKGEYQVRTIHLKSNVWLYIEKGAIIRAIPGTDAARPTWFSDEDYRTGLSPTQIGPYVNPENWLTKQDIGHTFFNNAMFFAERQHNIKIIGNGRISGNEVLFTGSRVDKRPLNLRGDKMFSFKLCENIEIGGISRKEDLWYDEDNDEPYYIKNNQKDSDISNMLHIDQGGHFVLLATGTDNMYVHDTYFGKENTNNARDIYDFMGCNNVVVKNIYSKLSSDDIVKLGSDCSLGFTRPVSNYKVRNVIGDTHCNLFQIGSETADDITNVHVDNIYVLGANKAGFSISTNDGAHVKDIHLNCGHTGIIHSRSKMFRSYAPFFISISNRARILGATVGRYKFDENGIQHDELLATNVNIGQVENVILNGVDVNEVYRGSSFKQDLRWKPYDGTQPKATPIVSGYKLPKTDVVEGGLNFTLPNGAHTGYIKNISFNDINFTVKGGNRLEDINNIPPELGLGQYNVKDLKTLPSYGLWVRHAKELNITNCTFNYEKSDSRYPIFLEDVLGAKLKEIKTVCAPDNEHILGVNEVNNILLQKITCYKGKWNNLPITINHCFNQMGRGQISISNP